MDHTMALTEPVEDLLRAMSEGQLAGFATELRAYLEDGLPSERIPLKQILAGEGCQVALRHRTPREEVIDACDFIASQLIEPYRMIGEAEILAGSLGGRDRVKAAPQPHAIMLLDQRFAESEPVPAVTKEELAAARDVAAWLPAARRSMLSRLGEDEALVPTPSLDPRQPDGDSVSLNDFRPTRSPIDGGQRFVGQFDPPPLSLLRHELGLAEDDDGI